MINKFICLLISIMLLVGCTASALADVQFDPSNYTKEELLTIDAMITSYLRNTNEGNIIYDENGITIEFRRFSRESTSKYQVELFITNETDEELHARTYNMLVNRCEVDTWNGQFTLRENSLFSTKANRNILIQTEDLAIYELESVERIDFEIRLTPIMPDGDYDNERALEIKLTIILDEPYAVTQ